MMDKRGFLDYDSFCEPRGGHAPAPYDVAITTHGAKSKSPQYVFLLNPEFLERAKLKAGDKVQFLFNTKRQQIIIEKNKDSLRKIYKSTGRSLYLQMKKADTEKTHLPSFNELQILRVISVADGCIKLGYKK